MTSVEISSKQKWEKAHRSLNTALKKEIHLMREILANLHQEELSLLENDSKRWDHIMDERSQMVMQLKTLRSKRVDITTTLEKLAIQLEKKELFPLSEESSCELLTKLDQMIALMERINLQNCRNDALFDQSRSKKNLPLYCLYPHPLHQPQRIRRKTAVATYPDK